jgi:molecular chaperone DnaK
VFSTAEDYQTAVDVHVLQGERPMAADNNTLGVFRLQGIPSAPRGIPQIEVTFDIDANGILNVTAKDRATGQSQAITITANTNLNESDIERMVNEAEQNAAEDSRRRELIEARNMADQVIYQTEKSIQGLNGQVAPADREQIEARIATLKETVNGEDVVRIKAQTAELQQIAMTLGQAAAQANDSGDGAAPPSPGGSTEEDVIEGEFEAA